MDAVHDPVQAFVNLPRKYVKLSWEPQNAVLTLKMAIRPVQCYSLAGMKELQAVLTFLEKNQGHVKHMVTGSDVAGVFNFGGDLALFVLLARARDVNSLRLYGQRCLDLVWGLEMAASWGVHTVALIQGDALGGGLESALPFHRMVAERGSQMGYPEVLFNLFPGMGAWQFTSRKAGFALANEMVLSGKAYSAEELHARGLVDVLAERGEGEAAVAEVIRAVGPRLRGTLNAIGARNLAVPLTRQSLDAVVDAWAQAALGLTDRDLKLMERLVRAQLKKVGGASEGAIEEIKRMELEAEFGPLPLAA